MLNLEKDPACFSLWEGQPIDASQEKWTARASQLTLSLEAYIDGPGCQNSLGQTAGLWRCVDLKDACIEVAMATADGSPLLQLEIHKRQLKDGGSLAMKMKTEKRGVGMHLSMVYE
ncbi:hypothetical protein V8G54_026820 [Vigna mungo]|uniref:Uncharacterized protein n=1 Tax=Vigna mungo TaxID=3915 RepID=A0AAQ3RQT4_VIGMU